MSNKLLISSVIRPNLSSLSGESVKIFSGTVLRNGMEANMAKQRTAGNVEKKAGHIAYWKQPWVQRVLQGNYSSFEKLLFMRVASFGRDGCWMHNEAIIIELGRCERTIRTAIAHLCEGSEFWITGWDSHKRCIYANKNPEVQQGVKERYEAERSAGRVTDKADYYRKLKTKDVEQLKKEAEIKE